ncbi:mucoidy inhibitor MuiA family protein [Celeribacter neptunius]|uniref:DUF4139 domain-containing protein n=1 Tax=Celeribacter neptunius TaxID=588602 RepID=A0A1I3WXI4_9RHOB|nr:mucoidy inhibitor MuiA family protein [Celeribacter neptunius]SFK11316.1 conserved hypothetical protein [Celeribacter neptunius]
MFPTFVSKSFFFACSALVAVPAFAERFEAQSLVTAATLYPSGAMITREASVTLPAGAHEIAFADIPMVYGAEALRATLQTRVEGAALGPLSYAVEKPSDAQLYRSEAELAAKARLDALEAELRDRESSVAAIRLEALAAGDTLAYLGRLADAEGADAAAKAATAQMIREQSLAARLAKQDAERRAEVAEEALDSLQEDIRQAQIALDRLVPSREDRLAVTLPVTLTQPGEVHVTFTYMAAQAQWVPLYTARLDTQSEMLELTRSVLAIQNTGEPWFDVALSFATDDPNRNPEPQEVYEHVRRIYEPRPVEPLMRTMASEKAAGYAEPVFETAPVVLEDAATMQIAGLSQTYVAPNPVRLYSDEAGSVFELSSVTLAPEIAVRAVPLYEERGYLMASFTNDAGEMLVPGRVQLIRDGVSLGETALATVVNGDEAELAFGEVQGIQVTRTLLSRNEGDRGVISKSNETGDEWRIELSNLTEKSWPIEVVDRVSVSEQDDLKVDWSADPMPDVEGLDDKRGVLAWHFDLASGASREIRLSENLRWPEGQELR